MYRTPSVYIDLYYIWYISILKEYYKAIWGNWVRQKINIRVNYRFLIILSVSLSHFLSVSISHFLSLFLSQFFFSLSIHHASHNINIIILRLKFIWVFPSILNYNRNLSLLTRPIHIFCHVKYFTKVTKSILPNSYLFFQVYIHTWNEYW